MSGSVKKNQLKTTVKIPGEQREKKCIAAHEKLNLNKTDRINKLTAAQIEALVSKKQEGVCLDFTSQCFQFETSEWLNDFPNALKELDLTGQSLTEFHVEHLGKLKNLILAKNSISKMQYDGLVNLEQLVLSNNRIEQLTDMGDLKKLVNLDLSSNRITTGWTELEKLQSLRVLDLADCSIDLTVAEFYNFVLGPLKKIHKLEYVNFMGNPVEKNISEFKYFIINEMPKLKYLDWDPITKTDRQLAEKLSAEGKWADKTKAIMVKRGSLVAIARPERTERPDRPVNNREKERDPNAPGCKLIPVMRVMSGTNKMTARLSVLLKDENYSVGTLRAMEQLDAIISANLSDGDELSKLEEMLKSSNGDKRQQVDYLSLLNDMVTDDSKPDTEKADLVARGSTIDNLMAGLSVDLNIDEKQDSQPTSSEPKSAPKSEPKPEAKSEQKSGDFLDMLTDIINEAPKSNGTAAKTTAKPAAAQPEQKDYLALLDEMMNMSAEIETPLSPRTINHQKKSPRQAMNELEETLSSIEKAQEVKPSEPEKKEPEPKPVETPAEVPAEKPVEPKQLEPVTPVVAVTPPKGEMRKSTSLVDELAASIDSLEESIRRNSPSVTRKSNDSIPPVPPQPSNPKIVLTNAQAPKASPKKDAPKVGVKAGVKKAPPKQSVSGEVDGELQKKLGAMRERSESQKTSNESPSKPSELDSVLDSLAALSQQPLDKSKGQALNLSNSAATTASITDLIDSYSNKPLPSPPPKRKSTTDSNSGAESPKMSPKKAVAAAPKQPEVQEVKPEPVTRPKAGSVSISPQVKPDANPLGNLLDQLIVSATTPSKPKLSVVAEETPKRPPPLSMAGVVPTSNSVQGLDSKTPLSPVDTYQIDEYLAVKTPSKSNLEHQPRYVRGLEPRTRPQWDADMNEIDIRERLGQGVFGETWMAFWSGEVGRKVTVKKLVDLDFSSAALEALRNETKKLMYLKHPNIAGVIGSGVKDAKYIMAEYIEGVSAYAYLRNPSVPIGSPFILSMARQAAAGLFYLHEQGIIHGSFKSKNVLIDRDNIVHLKDFGYLDSKDVIDRLDAQPQFLAPEVITGSAYTEKIDVYSFGMFLWELFTKQTPFLGLTPNQVVDEIIYRQLRPEVPPTCPIVFEKLIRACWSTDPNQRPGFDKIIKILNMSEEKIFSYGDRLPSAPASTKSLSVPGSSSPAGPRYNKPKRLSMKFSADEEKLDPETATKLNMVLDKIIELILSNDTQSQLRGVKSIETLLKTPGRLPYIARNTDVIRALIVMIDTPIPPGPLSPELEIVEVAVRVIMELSRHPSMGQPLREYRAIGAFVRLLSVEGRDGLAIMAAKAMSQFALDPENAESIKLSGALIPLVNLLHSNNEFVLIQVCSVLTALLEDEESSKNFLTAGGLERLIELLQLSNPALQLRALDVMSNYLGNEAVQPHLASVNIKTKYLSMLNAPSPALKATGVKAMTKFAQKDVITEESEMARVLKALIDAVTVSTDSDMVMNALKALAIFTQKLANAIVFRNIGGLSMTFRALNNGNLDIVKSAMELFANLLKDEVGRDALIALGSCGPLVKYLPYEDKALRLVLLNNLVQLVDKNDKGIRGLAAAAGVTPVVSVLCYSDSDEEKILALKIVSNVATNPELCNDVREAGGVPVLLELMDKKSSEALLIKGAETLQLLVEQNASNRALVLQEQGLSMLANSLLYLPVRAQEHIVNLFGVYAREGLKSDDLLTALRSSGAIQALAQMLSLRADEEPLILASIRLLLTMTQDEHTKGLVRDLTMIELQKLTLSPNATIQNAAKKIVSLF